MHRTFSQFLLITETNLCVVVHSRLHTRQPSKCKQHLNSLQFHLQDDRKLFSALTPLAGRQEVQPACKNSMTSCWCGDLTGARCRLFAYGPAYATAVPKPPPSPASFKSRLVLPSWYWPTQVVVEKRQLNRYSTHTFNGLFSGDYPGKPAPVR